jgi:GDP-L-fucose synthase
MQKKINILITGSGGFIGRNLSEHLGSAPLKYALFCPPRNKLDLLDAAKTCEFIRKNKIELVIHCANVGGSRKTAYDAGRTGVAAQNLRMFFNLARSGKRIISLGSGAEYGRRHYKPRMKETYFGAHIPEDEYGLSKHLCARYIQSAPNIVNLRLFGVFGKYENYEFKFISNAIVKNLLGLPITINQNVRFDFLYINDCVRIIEYFIKHKPRHHSYNLATGATIDLITIAKIINSVSEKPSEIIIKNKGLNTEYSANNKRLLKELKGFKFTPIEKAIRELYLWYKKKLGSIDCETIKKDPYIKYCRAIPSKPARSRNK